MGAELKNRRNDQVRKAHFLGVWDSISVNFVLYASGSLISGWADFNTMEGVQFKNFDRTRAWVEGGGVNLFIGYNWFAIWFPELCDDNNWADIGGWDLSFPYLAVAEVSFGSFVLEE